MPPVKHKHDVLSPSVTRKGHRPAIFGFQGEVRRHIADAHPFDVGRRQIQPVFGS